MYALIVTILISYSFPVSAATLIDRIEASINSDLIFLSDVYKFKSTLGLREQLDPLFATTSLAKNSANITVGGAVDFLINERVIRQKFSVTDAEVDQEIVGTIQASNGLTRDALKQTLKQQGFSFDDYFEMIRMSLSKRNLIDRDIRTKVSVTESDIKNYYYNKLSRDKESSVLYKIQMLTVSFSSFKTQAFAKDHAEAALKELQNGEGFSDVAKRFGDDEISSSGGDLGGFLGSDQLSPSIRDHIKKMKISEISKVLSDSKTHFFILRLADIKEGDESDYLKNKESIRNQLAATEFQQQIEFWLERERQSAHIHLVGEGANFNPINGK